MKIKLDENLGRRCITMIRAAGHDVSTVKEQNLCGSVDEDLIRICGKESRCIVTLDLDFANPLRFRPDDYAGIAVIRLPSKPSFSDLLIAVQTFIEASSRDSIHGKLWIIEAGRIRVYRPRNED